ncbi:MAG: hypothetical protein ACFB2Z_09680 [Maricaulaceae bacterium]
MADPSQMRVAAATGLDVARLEGLGTVIEVFGDHLPSPALAPGDTLWLGVGLIGLGP